MTLSRCRHLSSGQLNHRTASVEAPTALNPDVEIRVHVYEATERARVHANCDCQEEPTRAAATRKKSTAPTTRSEKVVAIGLVAMASTMCSDSRWHVPASKSACKKTVFQQFRAPAPAKRQILPIGSILRLWSEFRRLAEPLCGTKSKTISNNAVCHHNRAGVMFHVDREIDENCRRRKHGKRRQYERCSPVAAPRGDQSREVRRVRPPRQSETHERNAEQTIMAPHRDYQRLRRRQTPVRWIVVKREEKARDSVQHDGRREAYRVDAFIGGQPDGHEAP